MAFGDNESRSLIIPNEDGKGNTVYLESLPFYEETEKGGRIVFPFVETVDGELYEYRHGQLDPFLADTPKKMKDGLARLFHLYSALVHPEKFDQLKNYDEKSDDTAENLVDFANGLLDESVLEMPIQLLITYNDKGYLQLPLYTDVISSEHRKKRLVHSESGYSSLRKPVSNKRPDNDISSPSKSDM